MNLVTKQKKTQRTDLRLPRRRIEERDGELGINVHTLLYLKWITNKDPPYSTWNSAQCYLAARMGGAFGGDICMCMVEFFCYPPETVTTLLISDTLIQNKKFNKNKKNDLETPLNVCVQHHLTCEFNSYWSCFTSVSLWMTYQPSNQ